MIGMIFVLTLVSSPVFAGHSVGNGGGSIICRDSDSQSESVVLQDLYEAAYVRNPRLSIPGFPSSMGAANVPFVARGASSTENELERVLGRLPAIPGLREDVLTVYGRILQRKRPIPAWAGLQGVADDHLIYLPRGCRRVQLGNYLDPIRANSRVPRGLGRFFATSPEDEDRVYYDETVLNQLDEMNQLAFWLHETFYYLARKNRGVDDSASVRFLVGLLFSVDGRSADIQQALENIGYSPGFQRSCGLVGGLQQRVRQCASVYGPGAHVRTENSDWILVQAGRPAGTIWYDSSSRRLWTGWMSTPVPFLPMGVLLCGDLRGTVGEDFLLPSRQDFSVALDHGFSELPIPPVEGAAVWLAPATENEVSLMRWRDLRVTHSPLSGAHQTMGSVRCVSRKTYSIQASD